MLCAKRHFADVIKGLEMGRLFCLIQMAQYNHRVLVSERGRQLSEEEVW